VGEGAEEVAVVCEGVTCEEVMEERGGVGSTEERGGKRGEEDEREERRERDADAREEEEREDSCWR
jgi:hypothetical protein